MLATLDVGTNSVKLLVARVERGRILPIEERVLITRLGEGVNRTHRISSEAMDRTLEALVGFREIARRRKAWQFSAVGTRVLRAAKNAQEFVHRCKKELDLSLRILSGKEEARLSFLGAAWNREVATAVDIGGGSTEFMIGRRGRLLRGTSVNLGAVALTERFFRGDPVPPKEMSAAQSMIRKQLSRLSLRFSTSTLLGIGGTVATAISLHQKRTLGPKAIQGARLTTTQVDTLRDRLATLTLAERKKLPGLEPARADIIVAGLVILSEVLHCGGFHELRASTWGIRHGVALEMAFGRKYNPAPHDNRP
jgi:exopolyphosphatase/guanosine-5'-triphosphate,3'-diphosphate pyrophosphatase